MFCFYEMLNFLFNKHLKTIKRVHKGFIERE